jgi:hypothetical protein
MINVVAAIDDLKQMVGMFHELSMEFKLVVSHDWEAQRSSDGSFFCY